MNNHPPKTLTLVLDGDRPGFLKDVFQRVCQAFSHGSEKVQVSIFRTIYSNVIDPVGVGGAFSALDDLQGFYSTKLLHGGEKPRYGSSPLYPASALIMMEACK